MGRQRRHPSRAAQPVVDALDAQAREHLVSIGVEVPKERVEGWFDAWAAGDPVAAEQATPEVPMMALCGAEDPFVNKDILGLIEARFSGAIQHNIRGAGHWPHVEAPGAVAAELLSFLGRVVVTDGQAGDSSVTEEAWTGAFHAQRDDSFAATLSADVVLHASSLRRPVSGRGDDGLIRRVAIHHRPAGRDARLLRGAVRSHGGSSGRRLPVERYA